MRAPVSRSRPLRTLAGASNDARLATSSPAGPPRARGRTGVTRAGVSGRVAELVCVSVVDQGLKRDVVARPGRRQCHVAVLGTVHRRQAGRDERLEGHHVRLAPGALRERDGLARAPALWAWESRTGPGAQTQIDSSAFEIDIAAHHAPRRLKLQRKLEELLHAPDRDAVGHRPGMVSARPRRARSRTIRTCMHYRTGDMGIMYQNPCKTQGFRFSDFLWTSRGRWTGMGVDSCQLSPCRESHRLH
jgi:hypothetical protein